MMLRLTVESKHVARERRTSWTLRALGMLFGMLALGASGANEPIKTDSPASAAPSTDKPEKNHMWMTVGERRFAITLANTEAAAAFVALLPLTLDMPDLNGNEKHVELPKALPTNASRPGTIRNGDLMLYGSRTLVVFYLTFDSAYSYTRLGKAEDPANLAKALGHGTARITFSRT